VRVGGHLEAGVGQQEAADVGEARVDVLPDVLQLLVLVLLHLVTDGRGGGHAVSPETSPTRQEHAKKPVARGRSPAGASPGSSGLPPGRTGARRGSSSL